MTQTLCSELALRYLPELPRRSDWRIGCIGAGFIMRDCHLVAYQQAGWQPLAIASRRTESAAAVAQRFGIPTVHEQISDLLHDPRLEVLDIAVPPDVQPEIIRQAVEAGRGRLRGILAQKPLALSLADAQDLVQRCAAAGITLAVNQNMRFDQSVRAAKDLIARGWLGEIVLATIDMRAVPHWMPWAQHLPSLTTFVMSIHHLDTFRYWLGTPDRVLASTRPDPRTRFPHRDGINLYILEYDAGPRAAAWDDVWAGPGRAEGAAPDHAIRWRIEGTDGVAQGTIGWPKYPAHEPSTLEFCTRRQGNYWFRPRWEQAWFPEAFIGTMAQLLVALEQGTEPEISGRDNLETIALCTAVYRSSTEHRAVALREILTPK
ncbi:MAG: Gfo/Idh/MocA family oxidoreductase [Thermogemmata sp.]|jgi:predicted dehydrogenase|uniref:Gfo/Idh/MocA family oxidoreductase n=1 Tax=Thermogemmata fonticola TaxID=2755323 RepID=A0A7V9ACB4_9BACT|nr:Gfo/Idh/MocA family oxidoreductase [Thermogemmata fonticola]MBA2226868.1 Gfo/Idh/MocA family oxidoreductase [Thermogemmata fonticola]MCX8139419.1 Gfo/Idh/MocA family oxidoreductase [Gemmataceae bacterium]